MGEAMPLLVRELQKGMFEELKPLMNRETAGEERAETEAEQRQKRDRELYARAYVLPEDSIEVVPGRVYERGMSTLPSLHSIERRKNDTKVTFFNIKVKDYPVTPKKNKNVYF